MSAQSPSTLAADTADLYQEIVMRHAKSPAHRRTLPRCDARAEGDNPLCGDRVSVEILRDSAGRVIDCGFEARGCAIVVASADMMAGAVQGLTENAITSLSASVMTLITQGDTTAVGEAHAELRALSGVAAYRSRMKCASLPWAALRAALHGQSHTTSEGELA